VVDQKSTITAYADIHIGLNDWAGLISSITGGVTLAYHVHQLWHRQGTI